MARQATPTRVGKSSDFEPGAIALVEVNGRQIGIVRLRSGELRAVLNHCPHKGAPICKGFIGGVWQSSGPGDLSFDADQDVLVCPWHGFEYFAATGEPTVPSPEHHRLRLRTYAVEVVGGDVVLAG